MALIPSTAQDLQSADTEEQAATQATNHSGAQRGGWSDATDSTLFTARCDVPRRKAESLTTVSRLHVLA